MYEQGLNGIELDGWQKVARNSDEDASDGDSVADETIDRFKMNAGNTDNPAVFIVRQLAVHTQPHTSAEKADLESNYLTQP